MARLTIRTRTNGKFEFFVPDTGGYVRLECPGFLGTMARQTCAGGGFRGSTLTANSETLERVARAWYRQFRKSQS